MQKSCSVCPQEDIELDMCRMYLYLASEIEQGSSIELSDGLLYPLNVIPEGKSKMLFEDYLRGLK